MIVLSKRFPSDVLDAALKRGDVSIGHDFTEYLNITNNEEMQSNVFGGGVTVSIEGYSVTYFKIGDNELCMDFHSYLSDDKTQIAGTVKNQMQKLISHLMLTGVLKAGGRILGIKDGCRKQYKSATSIFFMSVLAEKFKIVVDCGVCCPGHGKSIVDAINGIDKNAILRLTIKKVSAVDLATKEDSKDIKIFTAIDSGKKEKFSAAEECVRLLEQDHWSTGLKSTNKRRKREIDQQIHE